MALGEHVAAICGTTRPEEIRSGGGAARSALWLQIKADVLGVPIRATRCPEPTSLGAAMLAKSARGECAVTETAQRWVRLGPLYRPDAERHRRYRELLFHG
jgi:sugar (pentulose or hexulose) kinase